MTPTHTQPARAQAPSEDRARRLLERALPLLRCPACRCDSLTLLEPKPGLLCADCGRACPFADGVLDLSTGPENFTAAQRSLQRPLSTCLYERFRWLLARALVGQTAQEDVERFGRALELKAGDTLLDVACGPAHFAVPLAQRVAPGLVIGLDVSPTQLERAVANVARAGLDNVLLVRGDVHQLPLRDRALVKVNCAGGLHQFPAPGRALVEMGRVLAPGGRLSGSTFARHPAQAARRLQDWMRAQFGLHWVDLVSVQGLLERAGLRGYRGEPAPLSWFGYYVAERA